MRKAKCGQVSEWSKHLGSIVWGIRWGVRPGLKLEYLPCWDCGMLKENPLDVLPSATGDVKAGPYILPRPEGNLSPLLICP